MKPDLHTHSTASDGTLSPTELVSLADSCGVDLLALTDHDTVGGVAEAAAAAASFGIPFVPGVEVSTLWHHHSIHIVGLGVSYTDGVLDSAFARVGSQRLARRVEIGRKLESLGFPGAYEGALRFAKNAGSLSRMHFARWMKLNRYVPNVQDAFDKYLGDGCPAFVETVWPTVGEGIRIIRSAGGIPVLAHPGRYKLEPEHPLSSLVELFVSEGGRGIEVCSGSQSPDTERAIEAFARRHGLFASVGSDFHSLSGHRPRPGDLHPLPAGLDPVWRHIPGIPESFRTA